MSKLLFLSLLLWLAQAQDQISITLLNDQHHPIGGWTMRLVTYRFNARGTTAEEIPSGECVTDPTGHCDLMVLPSAAKDRSGFLRGSLDVDGHGKRPVLWPGGLYTVQLQLDGKGKLPVEGEAAPFDYDEAGGVQIIAPQPVIYPIGIILAVGVLALTLFLWRKAKKR